MKKTIFLIITLLCMLVVPGAFASYSVPAGTLTFTCNGVDDYVELHTKPFLYLDGSEGRVDTVGRFLSTDNAQFGSDGIGSDDLLFGIQDGKWYYSVFGQTSITDVDADTDFHRFEISPTEFRLDGELIAEVGVTGYNIGDSFIHICAYHDKATNQVMGYHQYEFVNISYDGKYFDYNGTCVQDHYLMGMCVPYLTYPEPEPEEPEVEEEPEEPLRVAVPTTTDSSKAEDIGKEVVEKVNNFMSTSWLDRFIEAVINGAKKIGSAIGGAF